MTPAAMVQRTREFSLRAMRLCAALPSGSESRHIKSQLGRCSTSVAANYRAAQRARSRAEFRSKLGIVEEEADECVHWLTTIIEAKLIDPARVQPLLEEANELTAMTVSAIKTARSGREVKKSTDAKPSAIRHPPSAMGRIGHGFDLHRLEAGYPLIVGGVALEHDRGCVAHSDGDVVLHAVTDAVLGALGKQDIGQLFPDSDPAWKDADSCVFVREAARLMHEGGFVIGNLDVTVILERPKLGPHKAGMIAKLAELLDCTADRVNLKAKTYEGVDALGENRAIACHAVVLLVPRDDARS